MKGPQLFNSPRRLLAYLAVSIFVVESAIMVFFSIFPSLPRPLSFFLDATLLLIILIPCLKFLVLQPLSLQIADRKSAEKVMEMERNKLQGILDAMENGVCIINLESQVEYLNGVLKRVFGPVKGRKCYEYFYNRDELCPWCKGKEIFAGRMVKTEWRTSGAGRQFEISASRTQGDDGEIAMLKIVNDVTERREAEKKILQLSRAVERSPSCILITDKSGIIEYVNPKFTKLTGYTSQEVVGKSPSILKTSHTSSEEYKKLWETISSGCEWRGEFLNRKKNGELYWESASISPITNAKGVTTHFVAVKEDITDRKHADQELRSSREQLRNLSAHLEEVREEERTRIARAVHDELGQDLTALKMDALWLGGKLRAGSDNCQELLGKIRSMATQIDGTLKTVQRISSELRPGILDDLGIFEAIDWQVRDFQKRSGIRCEFHSTTFPEDVDRDCSTALFRILQEGLTNVFRHAEASRVRVKLQQETDLTVLTVSDNGKGITRTELSCADSLGLIGLRERVRLFKGTVTIKGIRNRGTVIKIRLPRTERTMGRPDGAQVAPAVSPAV